METEESQDVVVLGVVGQAVRVNDSGRIVIAKCLSTVKPGRRGSLQLKQCSDIGKEYVFTPYKETSHE